MMDFLRKIEAFIEKLMRRCAGSSGQRSVQPVEIGKHLSRIMLADRRVSTMDVYVPNRFTVFLSRKDWEKLQPLCITITSDIAEYLGNRARRHGVKFAAPVQIDFRTEDSLPQGTLRAEGVFWESATPLNQGRPIDGRVEPVADKVGNGSTDGTQVYRLPEAVAETAGLAQIVALDGPNQGQEWVLGAEPILLGRGPEQYVQLHDPSVSRSHAVIRLTQGRYWIEDSQSTNGLRVNGKLVKKAILSDGDIIELGNSRLQLRVVK